MRARFLDGIPLLLALTLGACAQMQPRGTGDLGVVIERESGRVQIVGSAAARVSESSTDWVIFRTLLSSTRATPATRTSSAATAD